VGKRIVFGSLVVVLLLLLSSASALASPGGTTPGQAKKSDDAQTGASQGPNGQGKSHAPQNASRGMNRPGAPGHWKSHGHSPAPVSAPQGHSPSDPDFNGNGGRDKPGESGGFSADKDGNNGCGNDDDREDDNNGWCGLKPHKPPEVTPPTTVPPSTPPGEGPTVLPLPKITRPVVEAEKLPNTGVDALQLSYAGLGLMLSGHVLRRRSHRRPR